MSATHPAGPAPAQHVAAALQAALAAENVAVYGYGTAGAHLTGRALTRAHRYWNGHQASRDAIIALLTARGLTPAPAAAVYRLPFAVHNRRTAIALAADLEDRIATAYLGLVALPEESLRALGAREVPAAALRAAAWRGHTVAFPGLPTPAPGVPGSGGSPSPGASGSPASGS